jgi:hypothetical protein
MVARMLGRGLDKDDVSSIDSSIFALSIDVPLGGVLEGAFQERPVTSRTLLIRDELQTKKPERASDAFN